MNSEGEVEYTVVVYLLLHRLIELVDGFSIVFMIYLGFEKV